ncbi:MAG: hypothetical protein K1W34_09920 [Lachnospiraceae bacterium]
MIHKDVKGSELIMYQTEDGLTKVEVTFEDDTVWLSIDQMAERKAREEYGKYKRLHTDDISRIEEDYISALEHMESMLLRDEI